MKTTSLKPGSILSETSFYVVQKVNKDTVDMVDDFDNQLVLGNAYVEKILTSADIFEKEEKKTMTELAELFINSPRIAMTVAFVKKDTDKTKKAYEAEKQSKIQQIQNAKVSDLPKLLNDLIENPLSKVIPGEVRVMKGRHYGQIDDLGRVQFVDMEIPGTNTAAKFRQVDPRSIQYLIISGIKYILK
jgi:hypothetical protein